jgi:hypothetical protein
MQPISNATWPVFWALVMSIRYAIDIGLRADDPIVGIRIGRPKSTGFRTWSEDDILLASMCSTNNDPPANVPAGGRVALSQSIGGIRR